MKFFDDEDIKYERYFDYLIIDEIKKHFHDYKYHSKHSQRHIDFINTYINNEYIIYLYEIYNIDTFNINPNNMKTNFSNFFVFVDLLFNILFGAIKNFIKNEKNEKNKGNCDFNLFILKYLNKIFNITFDEIDIYSYEWIKDFIKNMDINSNENHKKFYDIFGKVESNCKSASKIG